MSQDEKTGNENKILNDNNTITEGFIIEGLKSEHDCGLIKEQALKLDGVKEVDFTYSRGVGHVTFDSSKTDIDQILDKIEEKGFKGFILDESDSGTTKTMEPIKKGSWATKSFTAKGTTCNSCAEIIKKQALKIDGVRDVDFDYATEKGSVTFDEKKASIQEIFAKIDKKGYVCSVLDQSTPEKKAKKSLGWVLGLLGAILIAYFALRLADGISLPQISTGMSYGLLFLVGLLTGFHCIAMCGGFVVSYTAKDAQEGRKSHKSHLIYGLGKTISYTIIGAIFGLIGSIIAFTPTLRGVAGVLSGLFLVLFGLKMLNIFPVLRKIQFRTPRFIARFVGKESAKNSTPLVIGLLNGLMIACGPLQAIYIMAAGTGSVLEGAKLLFVFALGTLPVMLGFGFFASFISSKMTQKILKASGVIVIILGLLLMNNGLVLTGSGVDFKSLVSSVSLAAASPQINGAPGNAIASGSNSGPAGGSAVLKDGYQEIRMTVDSRGFTPNKFVLKKGVPVHWIIDGKQLNNCNRAIQVPAYGLKFDIKQGEQTIEFTPTEVGTIRWSCWMGMIQGTFIVEDNIDLNNAAAVQQELNKVAAPATTGGGCGGGSGGGGCGCGCGGGGSASAGGASGTCGVA
jgi:sulfite exporter TauE/SafE/copper chaperone CopZ